MTLLDHLLRLYPQAKRTTLRRMIESRRVLINDKPARTLKQPIEPADKIRVLDRLAERPATMPIPVVYEDADILVLNKPAGLLTSTVEGEKRATALVIVRKYLAAKEPAARVGLIHRLDRDASGLIIFSKTHEAYVSLKRQFFEHSVQRVYLAVVHGAPNPRDGIIDSRLLERADGSVHVIKDPGRGQRAITHYKTVSMKDGRALLRVTLETGKKHQIRAQLQARGVPIVNDPLYCDEKPAGPLMLAAVELAIDHPRTGKRTTFRIDPPPAVTNIAG